MAGSTSVPGYTAQGERRCESSQCKTSASSHGDRLVLVAVKGPDGHIVKGLGPRRVAAAAQGDRAREHGGGPSDDIPGAEAAHGEAGDEQSL